MVASTDIKFYVHTNTNAPQLQNAFGCMIDVLDACLINGYGSQTVSTLTASGTTVTATFGSAHNFMQYQVIKIAGAAQTEYNGEFRILTVPNANSITFQLAATPSVTTATGTINCSLPPLGWLKPYSGTGKAAYRSANTLLASRPYLRVVDALDPAYTATYAKYAKVGIVEDMTDIDTMLGVQAPYDSANPNKNWVGTGSGTSAINGWAKWYYYFANNGLGESTAPTVSQRTWVFIGTKDYFYIIPAGGNNPIEALASGFGAFSSILNADTSCTFLAATLRNVPVNNSSGYFASDNAIGHSSTTARLLLQRGYGTSQYIAATTRTFTLVNGDILSGSTNYSANKIVANKVYLLPVVINETSNIIRGELPGIKYLNQQLPYVDLQIFTEKNEIFIAKSCLAYANSNGQIVLKVGDL